MEEKAKKIAEDTVEEAVISVVSAVNASSRSSRSSIGREFR